MDEGGFGPRVPLESEATDKEGVEEVPHQAPAAFEPLLWKNSLCFCVVHGLSAFL